MPVPRGAGGTLRCPDILIVDDDPRNHTAFAALLEGLSVGLVYASSGEEALRHLLKRDFACILLDIQMPTMNGFETAEAIRSREVTRHLPIILITAHGQNEVDMQRGYRLGAVDFVFKPIVVEALRAKLHVFADLYRRTHEVREQAERLREVERRENLRRIADERRKWEAVTLKRRMREQNRLNERLADLDRRKDEFIAMLAHELRNPLAPLVTGLEVLDLRRGDDPIVNRTVDSMRRKVRHLTRLVDDLLEVSRISQGKLELDRSRIDVRIALEQALDLSRPALDTKQQTLTVLMPDIPVPVEADATRLAQVFSNLLNNAGRYSNENTNVVISCRVEGASVRVVVSDEGCGIEPELLNHVFESFVQGSDRRQGLGLGLTLVKRLVELHGGSVSVTSPGTGNGSEFVVQLPLAESPVSEDVVTEEPPVGIQQPHLRVAVVEDDEDVRSGLRDLLQDWGHDVFVAQDGPSGIDLLVRWRPDVALLDLGLPGTDGCGVARAVRERLGDCAPRLIALSGYGQESDRMRTQSAGFDFHMVKPPDPDTLQRLLTFHRGSQDATTPDRSTAN